MLQIRTASGYTKRNPSAAQVRREIAQLQPGGSLVLERVDGADVEPGGDRYIQVLMRVGNTYQLEYRDGVHSEHYQTLTVSPDKVMAGFIGWMGGKVEWRESFMWNNIGAMFEAPIAKTLG
ncbi:MAG: hypothetical protein ACRDVE_15230 [Actinocrinis sp.]